MKRIVAIGASNSSTSINKQLASWSAGQLEDVEVRTLDLNDYEMPIFSIDRERESGIPKEAIEFRHEIKSADALVISFAEHNGSFSAAFKNITDWMSRIEKGMWAHKPVLLMATSPGGRGGKSVLSHALDVFPHRAAKVVGSFSLPFFGKNFDKEEGIIDPDLLLELKSQLNQLSDALYATEEV